MTPPTGMSGTTGTIRHPDVSEISDLTEGLLSPSRTAEIRRHLGDCALCADVRTSLEEIRSLLGTLPGPARMPADIAGRIDAALAAEALLDATQPQAQAVPADLPRTPNRDVSRGTPPATAGRYPGPPVTRPAQPAPGDAARAAGSPSSPVWPEPPPAPWASSCSATSRARPPWNRRQWRGIRFRGAAVRRHGRRQLHRSGTPRQRQAAHRGRPGRQERSPGAEQHPRTGEHRPRSWRQAGSACRPPLRPASHRSP